MNNKKIYKYQIDQKATLLTALKQMDENKCKLLIVVDESVYKNLISIGDIQRAIIADIELSTSIEKISIDEKVVCRTNDSIDTIKSKMLQIRTEFMPVLDLNDQLVTVYFWDNLLGSKKRLDKPELKLPVVIMAGGKGTRLKPISNVIPKPLIPLGEKTIIENIMDNFIDAGCSEFYISVNYKKDMIDYYLKDLGYNIEYFVEDKPLGTVGSIHLIKDKIKSTFFVSNCDILVDQDLHDLYEYHKNNKNDITMVSALKHYNIPYGTLTTGEYGILVSMDEKPSLTFKINTGLYILEPHVIKEIPENEFFHITHLLERVKEKGGMVGVFPVSEKSWLDIGEWPEYISTVRSITADNDYFKGLS